MDLFHKAIGIQDKVIKFVSAVVKDFPEDKLEVKIGSSKTPLEIMNHILTGHYHTMQKANSQLSFKEFSSSTETFIEILHKQLQEYKEKGEEELSQKWFAPNQNKGVASIPWGIIRGSTHSLHHASQLIVFRHIYGLERLDISNEISWSHISNLITEFHYQNEPKNNGLLSI